MLPKVSSGDPTLDANIRDWLKWNEIWKEDYDKVMELVRKEDYAELRAIMKDRLSFGTAGIRGKMGCGFSRMNNLIIMQTTQGLAHYLIEVYKTDILRAKASGVVIGFDGRYNSQKWSKMVASVFVSLGFKAYLYSKMTPTPWVPFALSRLGCVGGVMITASHNPKEDNGYKVFWNKGPQILPPHDQLIQKTILDHLPPSPEAIKTYECLSYENPLLEDPFDRFTKEYYHEMVENRLLDLEGINKDCKERVVYSAMHGVGAPFIDQAMEKAHFQPVLHVEEQREADPDFPTVKFPNPEEGKSSLNLAIKTAETHGVQYILANDPDADRLAVAQRTKSGSWKVFTGNELGSLLGWFLYVVHAHKNPGFDPNSLYYIASTVSSKMLKTIAEQEEMNFVETLTGFKWMATKAKEIEDSDSSKTVLMAYEESIGYMCGTEVLDKDGIMAAIRIMELIAFMEKHARGKTLIDKLDELYDRYGYHFNINSYYLNYDPSVAERIFTRIRTLNGSGYPTSLSNEKYPIKYIRDLTTGYDSSKENKIADLPTSSSTQMITFTFEKGLIVTLRTSGTEPKIKYYAEYRATTNEKDHAQIEEECKQILKQVIEEFLQPQENKLLHKE